MTSDPRVDMISFTGSTGVGRAAMAAAAATLKKVSMELGGKNPQVIFPDADMDAALDAAAFGAYFNAGECCNAGSRLLLHAKIADEFLAALADRAAAAKVGDPLDPETRVGAIISADHLGKIEGHVRRRAKRALSVRTGGERLESNGLFMAPTIVETSTRRWRSRSDEVFGPVVVALTFETVDEAVALANSTSYGLSASVWSRDVDTAIGVGRGVRAGTVWVNTFMDGDAGTAVRRLQSVGRRPRTRPQRRQGLHRRKNVSRPHRSAHELVAAAASARGREESGADARFLNTAPDRIRRERRRWKGKTMNLRIILMASAMAACGGRVGCRGAHAADNKEVQMLHWWTSGGEAAALNVLKQDLAKEGYAWKDVPVAGGGGEAAMTTLKAMVAAGNPPTASQILGYFAVDYAEAGKLGDITSLATKEGWAKVVPDGAAEVHHHQRQVGRGSGQHPLGQLDLDQQGGDGQDRRHGAEDLRRFRRAARQGQDGRRHSARARRPALAGSDDVRLGRRRRPAASTSTRRRSSISTSRALKSDTMKKSFDNLAKLRAYIDPNYRRPRLEPRHRDGDQGRRARAGDGRLGQGRVQGRQQGSRQGFPLLPLPRHRRLGDLQHRHVRDVRRLRRIARRRSSRSPTRR